MKTIEEQFDEKFPSGVFNFYYKIQYIKKVKEIKQFYSSKISKLLGDREKEIIYNFKKILINGEMGGSISEGCDCQACKNFTKILVKKLIKKSEFNKLIK